jgi:uncharacterized protein (DUF2141 family)
MLNLNIFLIFLLALFQGGDHYKLTVTVSGLKPLKGDLYLSLHNRPEYFQVADSAFMKQKIAINEETETLQFDNLPAGTYAIAVYHDENLNGMMETSEKGMPREGYGFSLKSKFLGRPKFEQAAFEVSRNDTIGIEMIYPPGSLKDKDNN